MAHMCLWSPPGRDNMDCVPDAQSANDMGFWQGLNTHIRLQKSINLSVWSANTLLATPGKHHAALQEGLKLVGTTVLSWSAQSTEIAVPQNS